MLSDWTAGRLGGQLVEARTCRPLGGPMVPLMTHRVLGWLSRWTFIFQIFGAIRWMGGWTVRGLSRWTVFADLGLELALKPHTKARVLRGAECGLACQARSSTKPALKPQVLKLPSTSLQGPGPKNALKHALKRSAPAHSGEVLLSPILWCAKQAWRKAYAL